jgi:hypothetical protein
MSNICEECKNDNMAVIAKPQSKEDAKRQRVYRFIVCRECEPIIASFEWLEDGYDELKKALGNQQKGRL